MSPFNGYSFLDGKQSFSYRISKRSLGTSASSGFKLVPKLRLGTHDLEAPASGLPFGFGNQVFL